jgi:hypothetical protein
MTEVLAPPPEDKKHFPPMPPMTAPLWFGVLGAPAAWGMQLQTTYALVPWVCSHRQHHWLLHATAFVFIAIGVVCGLICWRYIHPPGRVGDETPDSPPGTGSEQGGTPGRTYFLSMLGVLTAGMFTTVIIAQGIAAFFIDPCLM